MYPNAALAGDQATAVRNRDGHFYFNTVVNGAPVRMMFDTGAGTIVLRSEDAGKAGIDISSLQYTIPTSTANGRTTVAPALIASMTIGDITRRNVHAFVSRPGALSVNLLGQSFMSRISGYKVDGERLILQGGR